MIRRNLLSVLAVLAIGAMVASPAEAGGGGGTKGKNGTVRVLGGQTGGGAGLILLPQGSTPPANYANIAALQAAGGAVINPGQVLQFKVAGPGTAYVADATVTPIVPAASTAAYSGAQNQTGYLKLGGTNVAPTIAGTGEKF